MKIKIIQEYEFRTEEESIGNILWISVAHESNLDLDVALKTLWFIANECDVDSVIGFNKYKSKRSKFIYKEIPAEKYLNKVNIVVEKIQNHEGELFFPKNILLERKLFYPPEEDRIILLEDRCDMYSALIHGNTESKFFSWVDVI